MILIITDPSDPHIPFVTNHLKEGEYIILDVGVIADGAKLTYAIDERGFTVRYMGKVLRNVTGVWYRRPRIAQDDLHLNIRPDYQDYAYSALQKMAGQLYTMFEDAVWISNVYAIRRAENKPLQLKVAKQLGFNVPETCFTSDSTTAEKFVKKHKEVIFKPLSDRWPKPTKKDTQPTLYARRVRSSEAINYSGLDLAPAIFQQLIEPDFELRVTVVGNKVFAAKIETSNFTIKTVRDWRLGHREGDLKFTTHTLPEGIARKCIQLTKELGLNFGAIDLIQAKDGSIWFLEINSNGQWGFVEWATGQQIGEAMAELLKKGKN
jgi:glutathione synthase/RimK-type ligase-like ATP-grasp enzyme